MPDTISHRKPLTRRSQPVYLYLFAIFLIAAAPRANAQPDDITLATVATPNQIENWLRSGDPRLIAWGAHFADEQNDQPALTLMVQMLALRSQYKFSLATAAMLDALIQRNATVPADALAAIAPFFPFQIAILAKNLPIAEATPLLLNWYNQRSGDDPDHLARVASMMLSHAPPAGFAASVLAESEETLRISVVSKAGVPGVSGMSSGSCAYRDDASPLSGWPPIFTYALAEDFQQTSAPLLVEAAGDRVIYRRYDVYKQSPFCGGLAKLNAVYRHYLLSQMLGISYDQMPWKTDASTSIVWHSNRQFVREAMVSVAGEEAKLHTCVEASQLKGLLTPDEAASVRPKLSIIVEDFRKPTGPPLPQLTFSDP